MDKIGIFYNNEKAEAKHEAERLKKWLKKRGCQAAILPSSTKTAPEIDFALCLGGDGTMLKSSRVLAPAGIPVMGINLGSLGFLAETNPAEADKFVKSILDGAYDIEERMMLSITISSKKRSSTYLALNDCLMHSGNNGRVAKISAHTGGEFLANYVGDGLLVATPTGSTAYSLAASGPIVHPDLSVFLLTPICPHTLTQRPMVLSSKESLEFRVDCSAVNELPIISIDGQICHTVKPGEIITISESDTRLKLIVNPKRKYFQILRQKLKWGERG